MTEVEIAAYRRMIENYQRMMDGPQSPTEHTGIPVGNGDPNSIARGGGESLRKYAGFAKTPAPARTMPAAALNRSQQKIGLFTL